MGSVFKGPKCYYIFISIMSFLSFCKDKKNRILVQKNCDMWYDVKNFNQKPKVLWLFECEKRKTKQIEFLIRHLKYYQIHEDS